MTAAGDAAITLRLPGGPSHLQLHAFPPGADLVSDRIRRDRCWEAFETGLCRRLLPRGGGFVDVGANIGYFTVVGADRVGAGGRVVAVEPDPDNFALLARNVAANGFEDRCVLLPVALAERDGAGRLYRDLRNRGDQQTYAGDGRRPSLPIEQLRGAEALAGRLSRIDLVKIDTQGSEAHVLAGLLPLLREHRSGLNLLVELTPFSLGLAGSSGRALIGQLAELDLPFWIVDHGEARLVRSDPPALARWCDNVAACEGDRGFMNILVGEAAGRT